MIEVESKYINVKTPDGRSLEKIINDINQSVNTNEKEVTELLDIIGYLVDRVQHCDSERFN